MGTLRTNTNIPALDEFVVIRTLVFENWIKFAMKAELEEHTNFSVQQVLGDIIMHVMTTWLAC